jgi:hypothetical protein
MAYELTVAGYTFENPPEEYRKLARLSNNPQPLFKKEATPFYQSDSQDLQLQVEGSLALNPTLGGTDDLDELEELQAMAISGGEVDVEFDPFFSGKCVIEDDPFRQSEGESTYNFTFTINSESTDDSAYPAHNAPDTGNTFELGDLDLGYDPQTVQQNYERQTEKVKRLQGVAQSVDNDGLITKIKLSGKIDGGGQATLWDKARSNSLLYLSAEFQNGWVLFDSVSIRNSPETPDYLQGLFQYDLDMYVVADPSSGIGNTTQFVDQEVQEQTQYVSDCDTDGVFERLGEDSESYPYALDYEVSAGTGKVAGEYVEWNQEFGTLDQSTTNYIWVEDPDGDGYGQVNTGTSGFPGSTIPLWEVDTGTSSVNAIRDMRSCLTGSRLENDELGDLNFQDEFQVQDGAFSFERLVSLTDSMALSEAVDYQGIARLSDTLAVTEGTLDARTITSFTESIVLDDGGSGTTGGGSGSVEATVVTSLNGESADMTVYEDTDQDGTAEQQQTVSLSDGQATYTLGNLSGGSGNDYWIKFDLSTSDITTTAVVDSATLSVTSGADADQNTNTTWEILGAEYDTSGNEYEGGGTVSRYGA